MNFIFSTPTLEDLIRLLRAWRFWVLGAMAGALIAVAAYYIVPPPYRARATVNVDFNLEQAWPQDVDRQQFYYLEREVRKLEEIALSDDVIGPLSSEFGIPVEELRAGKLQLSQPAEAGWHFYADDPNPQMAANLASAWANAFVQKTEEEIQAGKVNEFIKLDATQSENLPRERSIPLSSYLIFGVMGSLTLAVLATLLIKPKSK
jgi:capsular polysaccharide biosynthesis protein